MIEIRNVVKEFDGFRALDELSMSVPKGSVYGLVGPNGAGKSTIIRHLTGIYRQDSGDVLVDGQPVFENPPVKNRIAYIPDDIFYFANASIGEMASFYRSIYPQFDNSALTSSARCSALTASGRCASCQRACRSRRRSG